MEPIERLGPAVARNGYFAGEVLTVELWRLPSGNYQSVATGELAGSRRQVHRDLGPAPVAWERWAIVKSSFEDVTERGPILDPISAY